ncbi:uncharacterized protein SOCE26_104410 [Sorangium cellulosum]|uniref:PGRS family protein n=1 Tax=Sorangium cellulosum TaxID=56 RepID=A0A2L0FBB3_SORCE|nr:PGRS family protein [Sorangium cellulosum]AUX48898.1 uncharacterized protein SOCE26_104410 [Sorangium cellulosum]
MTPGLASVAPVRGVLAAALLGAAFTSAVACAPAERDFQNAAATGTSSAQGTGGASGSGGDGGTGGAGGAGGVEGCDSALSPAEDVCVLQDRLGIFVAPSGNDLNPGTRVAPVKTLSKAIELAARGKMRVYACADAFHEPIDVRPGVALFGGLACRDQWQWKGDGAKTTVATEPGVVPAILRGGEGTTRIEDFWFQAASAAAPGGSSIAVLAVGATAELTRCTLAAGDGAAGGPAAPVSPAERGPSGMVGIPACVGANLSSPPTVNPACSESVGGAGGASTAGAGIPGTAGLPAIGGGNGGNPGCAPGTPGARGEDGGPGKGGQGLGRLTRAGHEGAAGGRGAPGRPGQGGGGGGSTAGGLCLPQLLNLAGASGGSGGAGGCGGAGGDGGRPGGVSIGLASVGAALVLTDVQITAGDGGTGGVGGDGQPGGEGGAGGPGGPPNGGVQGGCPGGAGGAGGAGGPGGGGAGGSSFGIAHVGAIPRQKSGVAIVVGAAGEGGPGGNTNAAANAGEPGAAAAVQELAGG